MVHVAIVVLISCSCAGIINGTGLANNVHEELGRCCRGVGKFPCFVLVGIASIMLFCNQALSIV